MRRTLLKRIFSGAFFGLLGGFLVWFLSQVLFKQFFFQIEAQTYDKRMRLITEPSDRVIEDIVIIDVDERAIEKLGSYHQWPRTYWERLINYLTSEGASIIGIDFIFDPDRRHPEEDQAFKRAILESGIVCSALNFSQADPDKYKPVMTREPEGLEYEQIILDVPDSLLEKLRGQERLEPGDPGFINASATAGFVNLFPDPDGVLRRVPLLLRFNDHAYPAFAFQMILKVLNIKSIDFNESTSQIILKTNSNKEIAIPVDKAVQMLIYYVGYFKSFRYISFYDVLMKFTPEGYFKNKIVLIGSSLPGLFDLCSTPLQGSFPGVEVNANILYQILKNRFITQMSDWAYFVFVMLIGFITGISLIFFRPIWSVLFSLFFIFMLIVAGVMALESQGYWLYIVGPMFTIVVVFVTISIYRYSFEEKYKRRIRKVFSHYVSSSVVDFILKNPEKVKLSGERKICTVLFSDIAGFTTLSEQLDPEKLVTLLNEYLTEMTDIILDNRGMLDKYEGDAIIAVFGAPVEFPDHAEAACQSALKMQRRLAELRKEWKKQGKPELYARIGINTGEMVAGNMGSIHHFDYTVMGDSVNLASRLESANKLYDTEIVIGENTYNLVRDKFITRPLDLLRVKGKKKPVFIYELITSKFDDLDPGIQQMLNQYQKGFDHYLMRNWEWAMNHFRQALQIKSNDGPSRLYLLRCQEFLENPPGEDWDGVFVMKNK